MSIKRRIAVMSGVSEIRWFAQTTSASFLFNEYKRDISYTKESKLDLCGIMVAPF